MCTEVQTETAVLCLELLCMNFFYLENHIYQSHKNVSEFILVHLSMVGRGGVQPYSTHEIPE
jgi:hypothetical protein